MRDDIFDRIVNIEREILNYKTSQNISSRSIKTYKIESSNEFDLTIGPGHPGYTEFITFTADNQKAPFATIVADIYINGVRYHPETSPAFTYTLFQAHYGGVAADIGLHSNTVYWTFYAARASSDKLEIKFTIYATDTGRLEVIKQ